MAAITVLYVDDEPTLLEIGKAYLEKMGGFLIGTVGSATEALDLLGREKYDAIISDYQMPVMDGIDFLRSVRSSGNDIPFILFTGRGREEVVIRALNEGADFYLQKGGDTAAQFVELAHKIRIAVQRKQAVVALAESERRYRGVVETQTEFISRFLPDGTHVFANDAYCRYFKKSREEIIGRRFIPPVPLEDRDQLGRHLRNLTPDHPSGEIEHRIILPDGSVRWQWWSDNAIFDRDGNVIEYQSVGKDITDRKRTEEALRISENLYRTIFDFTGAASLIIGPDTKILRANAGWENLTGVPREEQENKMSWTVFFEKEDLARMKEFHYARRKDPSGVPSMYESRLIDVNRTIHTVIAHVGMIPGTGNSIASLVDITERRKAEDELRAAFEELKVRQERIQASEEKYRTILENMQECFYRTDANGRIVMIGPSGPALLGYDSPEELYGRDSADLYISRNDRAFFLSAIEKAGSVRNYEIAMKKKDGDPVTVLLSSHKYFDRDGKYLGIEGTFRDITDRKEAEEALRASEQRFRALAELVPVPIAQVKLDGTIVYLNPQFVRTTGFTLADIPTMEDWGRLAYRDREYMLEIRTVWQARIAAAISGDKTIEPIVCRIQRKDGVDRVIEFSGVVFGDYLLAIGRDLTGEGA